MLYWHYTIEKSRKHRDFYALLALYYEIIQQFFNQNDMIIKMKSLALCGER